MNRPKKRPYGLLLFLLLGGGLVVSKWLPEHSSASVQTAEPEVSDVLRVEAVEVVPRLLEEHLQTSGTVRASEQVELVSEVAGKVEEILFEEGARVRQGELLLKIDDDELTARRTQLQFQLELAEQREARQRQLLAEGVISQQDYERSLSEFNVLKAELEVLGTQLRKTELRAPFSGAIGLRWTSVGAYLTPNTRVANLQVLDPVLIDFSVPEKYAAIIQPGREVEFRVKSTDRPFTGRITAIEPAIDSSTRSLLVRARCANPDRWLWPGAFADVELVVRRIENALTVPSIAVLTESGGKKVFLYEEGKAVERQVETGIRTADQVQIVDGLEAGEKVIQTGLQRLRPGLEVELNHAGTGGAR